MKLKGKSVVVTGASSGMGKAIVEREGQTLKNCSCMWHRFVIF